MGDNTTNNHSTPVQIPGLTNVIAVTAGSYYSLALKDDGTVWAWGDNSYGQLGDGTNINRRLPVQVQGLTGVVTSIAAGSNYAMAVKSDGTLWGWGTNGNRQLGDGTNVSRTTPVQAQNITNVKMVSAGPTHVIAVLNDGTVWAWGYNGYGQLGDGTNTDRSVPAQLIGMSGASMAAAGPNFTLLLKTNGTLWSWGLNDNGQLGEHSNTIRYNPAQIMTDVSFIAAGQNVAGAVTTDGTVWAWGSNSRGQLGRGTTVNRTIPGQIKYAASTLSGTVSSGTVIAGTTVTLIFEDGVQTTTTNSSGYYEFTDLAPDLYKVTAVASGYKAESWLNAMFTSGSVNTKDFMLANVTMTTVPTNATIASGNNFSLYVHTDHTVWAWGYNGYGQLGDNTNVNRKAPKQIIDLLNVVSVAAGSNHSVALLDDGTVWTWGYNGNGQLGDSTTTQRMQPVKVPGLSNITAIAAGDQSTFALDANGHVWSWGYNGNGQLGDGTTTNRKSPVQILSNNLTNVAALAAGVNFGAALLNDGTVWTWGNNSNGQLGDGSNNQHLTPVQVASITDGTAIAAGDRHVLVLRKNGMVCTWGNNANGQLGDRTLTDRTSPVIVPGLTNVTNIAGGHVHSASLREDKTLWVWGANNNGQLGDGTIIQHPYPVLVSSLTDITVIGKQQGNNYSVVEQNNGTLWAWGDNTYGQLGNSTNINSFIPVAVGFVAPSGILSGVVTSASSSQPIAGALITINSAATGDRTATSGGDGTYAISGLPTASYSVSIAASGFQTLTPSNSSVTQAQTTTLNAALMPVDNTDLISLIASDGTLTPDFSNGTTAYTSSVANNVAALTITAITFDNAAKITINSVLASSGSPSGSIPLTIGSNNTITVMVTAQDGTTKKSYIIVVTRAKSANANLNGLNISQGTLSPSFDSAKITYTASVVNAVESLTITPATIDATATVKVNGILTASGEVSSSIDLNTGLNTITVLVTAQDGTTTKSYTIEVTRAVALSSIANLSGLGISQGTLSPSFDSGEINYTASVGNAVESLTITPATADATATVKVNGNAITSGLATINLSEGLNTITVLVTAQNGSAKQSYTIEVTRASVDNKLISLSLSTGTLVFSNEITTYDVPVGDSMTNITVTAAAYDASAGIKINGTTIVTGGAAISLNEGYNLIEIEVTPQSLLLPALIYTVKVIKPYSNNSLHLMADANGDSKVRIDDVIQIFNKSPEQRIHYDLNLDGEFNTLDIIMLLGQIDGI